MTLKPESDQQLDTSSDQRFTDYYLKQSEGDEALNRMRRMRDAVRRVLALSGHPDSELEVLDIGCNAGTLCHAWAELGHRSHGLDINAPLLDAARNRAAEAGFNIDYQLGTATKLPWDDASMDVCMALELLEHVEDWESCVNEMMRVVRPGGAICLTTTNVWCPRQQEFNLPLYSWYPAFLKARYVRLAMTTRPELANYAKFPAFHWFSIGQLKRYAHQRGFSGFDRYDVALTTDKGPAKRIAFGLLKHIKPLRFVANLGAGGTMFFAVKDSPRSAH